MLTGTNLFLVASFSATSNFEKSIDVPPDFTGTQVNVPHPVNGALYLKLRDDAETVQTLTLPVMPMSLAMQTEAAEEPAVQPVKTQAPAVPATVSAPVPETAPAPVQPKDASATTPPPPGNAGQ